LRRLGLLHHLDLILGVRSLVPLSQLLVAPTPRATPPAAAAVEEQDQADDEQREEQEPKPEAEAGPDVAPATHDDSAYAFVSDDVISDLVVMLPGPERQSTDGDQSGEHEQ